MGSEEALEDSLVAFYQTHNPAKVCTRCPRRWPAPFPTHTPARLLAKHRLGLIEKLAANLDGEVLKLLQEEWVLLTEKWGTGIVREIQLAMLLEENQT